MASRQWVQQYQMTERLGQEIMELINERNSLQRTGSNTAKVQSTIRTKMHEYSQLIKKLKESLMIEASSHVLTSQEAERRQNKIDSLISRERQINQAFKPTSSFNEFGRSGLLNDGFDRDRNDFWGDGNRGTGMDDDMSVDRFRATQQQVIAEQDKGLDELLNVIQRQKLTGKAIGDEIDYQNELIDDINEQVNSTNQKLLNTNVKTKKVTKKVGNCALLIIIVLLLIAIVVVAVVPK